MKSRWSQFRLWVKQPASAKGRALEQYNVAPRQGVFQVRRKILRQLLKKQINNQPIPPDSGGDLSIS
jgi:hypothetical protein